MDEHPNILTLLRPAQIGLETGDQTGNQTGEQTPPGAPALPDGAETAPTTGSTTVSTAEALPPPGDDQAPPAIANWLPAALLAVGVMLVMTSLLRRTKANNAKQSDALPDERIAELRSKAQGKENLERLMVDCEELTQRLAAHLDNKAAMLEQLITEADEKIKALNSAATSAPAPQQRTPQPEREQPMRSKRDEPEDPIRERIFELADSGSSPVEIAQATGQPTGQVELILALRSA